MSANNDRPEIVGNFCSDCLKKKPMFIFYAVLPLGIFFSLAALGLTQVPWFINIETTFRFIAGALSIIAIGLILALILRGIIVYFKQYCNPNYKPEPDNDEYVFSWNPHGSWAIVVMSILTVFLLTGIVLTIMAYPSLSNWVFSG